MKRLLWIMIIVLFASCTSSDRHANTIRVGYLPNLTHIHGLMGESMGWYTSRMGKTVEWYHFNAGPSIIEGLFSGDLDFAYVGPGPAIVGYLRSKGDGLLVVAGATNSGSSLVVRKDSAIYTIEDLANKKIASPQIANTQDLALRHLLAIHQMKSRDRGGDVWILPIRNSEQFMYFIEGQIDGAWTVEPWVTRLEKEAGGRILIDEKQLWDGEAYPTTLLVVRGDYLRKHPDIVSSWLAAHKALTVWIQEHPVEVKKKLSDEIYKHTKVRLDLELIDKAYERLSVTDDPMRNALIAYSEWLFESGLEHGSFQNIEGIVYHGE
ncbi:MAG: ABC transporter substrate-binding protein [Chlamydiota bacterium]|nr:ABC transporter substrate-binding protein [Chlamydiota bacterium]